ncbi:hypothetical protein EJ08DRAFT_736382 [Tothia fuscella]|uniref:Uncharacterized protein n=1 Tax=Tothia fuscella TaxID=1048955 RepID=A0A9P4TWD0_9PEZI|nr:hypothetical protein EJ08DRAFT_736382 [Tothia fuscella]
MSAVLERQRSQKRLTLWKEKSPPHPAEPKGSLPAIPTRPGRWRPLPAPPRQATQSDETEQAESSDEQEKKVDNQNEDSDNGNRNTVVGRAIRLLDLQRTSSIPRGNGEVARGRRDHGAPPRRGSNTPTRLPVPGRKDPRRKSTTNNKRIQDIIRAKQILRLETDGQGLNNDDSSAPTSASSIAETPCDLYDRSRPRLSVVTQIQNQDTDMYHITPIETDLGVLAVIASMPERSPSTKSKQNPNFNAFRSRNASVIELRSGSMIAVITPESSAHIRSVYLPGKIVIDTNHSLNSSCVLTPLDLLSETAAQTFGDHGRIESDDVVADDIVDFFKGFGPGFECGILNSGLDEFWVEEPRRKKVEPRNSKMSAWRPPHLNLASSHPRLSSSDHNPSGDIFSKSFDFAARPSDDHGAKRFSDGSSLRSESVKSVLPPSPGSPTSNSYSPGPASNPLPLPASPRKAKPGKRPPAGSPRISSFRRLLHSASTIV